MQTCPHTQKQKAKTNDADRPLSRCPNYPKFQSAALTSSSDLLPHTSLPLQSVNNGSDQLTKPLDQLFSLPAGQKPIFNHGIGTVSQQCAAIALLFLHRHESNSLTENGVGL